MLKCPTCESYDIIKRGFNYFKDYKVQKYECKNCKRMFCYQDRLPYNHISSEIVSLCIDLYLKGLSYRVIRQQLIEQFNIRVNHVTIYNWIQQHVDLIKKYVDTFKPKLSPVWQMDETFIEFKGFMLSHKTKTTKGNWCWVAIDTTTRYIVGMHLSTDKTLGYGKEFFELISKFESKPEVIATDGNPTYETCIKKYFPNAAHVKLRMITLDPNTSFIERFNGTIKNRTKTMRHFDSFYPCQNTLTAFQIYYNFLRPHMALNGKTPAQVAGVDLELPGRWTSLIRNALLTSS